MELEFQFLQRSPGKGSYESASPQFGKSLYHSVSTQRLWDERSKDAAYAAFTERALGSPGHCSRRLNPHFLLLGLNKQFRLAARVQKEKPGNA